MIPGGYDWADDMLKVKSMRRRLRDNFAGDVINPTRWEVLATGSGMTLTLANGSAQISTGTTLDDELVLLSRQSFMLPLRVMVALNLSQRIAGQTAWLELVSVTPETNQPDERNIVGWRLDGISATLANYEVGSDGAPRLGTASGVTIPTTAPAGWSVLELEPNSDECYFHGRALDGTGLRANSYARQQQLPDTDRLEHVDPLLWRPLRPRHRHQPDHRPLRHPILAGRGRLQQPQSACLRRAEFRAAAA